jgi:cold shock CspA family protein
MNRDRGPLSESRSGLFPEDLPSGRRVEAKVKWFNASKGFGFVTLSDGSQDAFLPMAILRRAGYEDVREGAWITCEISAGAKGPLVTTVLSVDDSTAAASEGVSTPEPVPFERSVMNKTPPRSQQRRRDFLTSLMVHLPKCDRGGKKLVYSSIAWKSA